MIESIEAARDVLWEARLLASLHRDAKLDERLAALERFFEGTETCNLLRAYNARLLGELKELDRAEQRAQTRRARRKNSGRKDE